MNRRTVSKSFALAVYLILISGIAAMGAATEVGSLTITASNAHGVMIWGGGNTFTSSSVATNGQLFVGSTGADPVPATVGVTTGISVTTGAGTITLNNTGVTSLSAGAGISLGATTGACSITNTLATHTVTAKTADYSVLSGDTATFFTTTGAAGAVNFTLPTAAAGLNYTFYVDAAQTLQVTAGSSTTIQLGGSTSASAGNITNNTAGACVTLIAIDSTHWKAISYTRTWTVT